MNIGSVAQIAAGRGRRSRRRAGASTCVAKSGRDVDWTACAFVDPVFPDSDPGERRGVERYVEVRTNGNAD